LTDSTEYWIEKSKEQYNRDRFGEALVSAEKAIEIDEVRLMDGGLQHLAVRHWVI